MVGMGFVLFLLEVSAVIHIKFGMFNSTCSYSLHIGQIACTTKASVLLLQHHTLDPKSVLNLEMLSDAIWWVNISSSSATMMSLSFTSSKN
jgi:hypothetical protein